MRTAVSEIERLTKRAHDITQDQANELQDVLRTLTSSGTALLTSARELIADRERLTKRVAELEAANAAIQPILAEVDRARTKFPTWPTDPLHALAVLGEEFGELTKEVLQLVYEPHKTNASKVREEAIQTAAMALRFFVSLDRYCYVRGAQHSQQDAAQPRAEGK